MTRRFPDRCFAFDQFGPLRSFVIGNSNDASHTVLAHNLQAHHRHPDVLAAQRRRWQRLR